MTTKTETSAKAEVAPEKPTHEWGVRYKDAAGWLHTEWGMISDPRTNGAIDADGEYQIAKRDWREVVAVGSRPMTEEKWEDFEHGK